MGYRVMVVTKRGAARLVLLRRGQLTSLAPAFTVMPLLSAHRSGELNAKQAAAAVKWAKRKKFREVHLAKPGSFPFLSKDDDTEWPTNTDLLRKLNAVGRRIKRRVHIVSGWRTPYKCWQLRMAYLKGYGNLAARCCSRYTGVHSWGQCGKDPFSNHADGNAADCGVIDKAGNYISIGWVEKARKWMRHYGLCLPVGPPESSQAEKWHVEVGGVLLF